MKKLTILCSLVLAVSVFGFILTGAASSSFLQRCIGNMDQQGKDNLGKQYKKIFFDAEIPTTWS